MGKPEISKKLKKSAEMAYDDILPHLGEFGRYQKKTYLLLCLPSILCALHKLAGVFLQANVRHRCQLPYESDNVTYNLPEMNMVIPWDSKIGNWSSCTRLDVNFTSQYFNQSIPAPSNRTLKCDKWIYDRSVYSSSAVTEFNLVCDDAHYRVMADSLFMLGALLGSIIFGELSDRYGRRPIFFISLVLQVVFGILAAVAPEYITFMICRLIIGSTTSGVFLVAYVIALEMVGPSKRLFAGVVCQYFFTTGYILTAAFAYFITDWRMLQVAISVPGILFLSYWWFIPESARWLITKGRGSEAKEILLKAAKENKVTIPEDILDNLLPQGEVANGDATGQDTKEKKTEKRSTIFDLFYYPNLRKKTLVILFSWFVNSGTYYGLSWNTSNLGGNDYLNFLLSGAVEIPGYTFLLLTLNRWGRKPVLCGCMLVGGVALLLTSVVPSDMTWLIITLAMIGKMVITASYGTVYIFSAEQFPTVVRNIGIGAASTSARIGGILAPYTLLLSDHWKPLPLLIYGALALIGGMLSLMLPETLNKKLPDSIAEGELFGLKSKDVEDLDDNMTEMHKISNS